MSGLANTLPAGAPLLQFSCGHCGSVLSVPKALAGVKGPCPSCRQLIAAPGVPDLEARGMTATPVPPRPRLPKPAPPPEARAVEEERRSPLRPPKLVDAHPKVVGSRTDEPRRTERNGDAPETPSSSPDALPAPSRPWTWAAVGAVVGGGLVFAGLSATQLRRDISPAPHPAASSSRPAAADSGDDAVAALAAHKKESTRDLKSMLAAQQAVWRFFDADSAKEAQVWISDPGSLPLPASGLHSPLTGLTLRSKHRLPNNAGTASQWTVATARFGELTVEVTDASGQPRLNWAKLAPQLGTPAAEPDLRTAAAP